MRSSGTHSSRDSRRSAYDVSTGEVHYQNSGENTPGGTLSEAYTFAPFRGLSFGPGELMGVHGDGFQVEVRCGISLAFDERLRRYRPMSSAEQQQHGCVDFVRRDIAMHPI